MAKKVTDKSKVTSMVNTDCILGVFGGKLAQMEVAVFRQKVNENQELHLNEVAFYIEVNTKANSGKSTGVNVGGNLHMLTLWLNEWKAAVMDKNGNYAELSDIDNRYTSDGLSVVDANGDVAAGFAECNFMGIMPVTGCYLQTVTVNGAQRNRLWMSLMPLSGGWIEKPEPVGMFKMWVDGSGRGRSLPNKVPTGTKTNYAFWQAAQKYGKDWGNAGIQFRNMLLWRMMAKYESRDSQGCTLSDGTPVWGVGLDGTESTSAEDKFAAQRNIKTGATLSLGSKDGKVAVTDANGQTCHSVKCGVFENPWGQYWEMDGHLASIGTTVYHWRSNFLPSAAPVASTFNGVDTVQLTRHTAEIASPYNGLMNEIVTAGKQGVYMIPKGTVSGIAYNDRYYYGADGQLWLWGGYSNSGAICGLAYSGSDDAWAASYAVVSARLDFHGQARKVTGAKLLELLSA